MQRKLVTILVLVSMALAFYSSTLTTVSADEGAMLVTLDVCSDQLKAGPMSAPMVPEPVFSFDLNRTFDTISWKECLIFTLQYPAVLDRPPTV
jgi:hypothetical protein